MNKWTSRTWAYITLAHLAGIAVWIHAFGHWHIPGTLQFLFYAFFSAASSTMKVPLPGIKGSLSVNYVFILLAVLELSLPQTMAVAVAGSLTQCALGTRKRPKLIQVTFNLAGASFCSWLCYLAYGSSYLRSIDASWALMLFWSVLTYYVVNTLTVSGVIATTEGKSVLSIWHEGFFWTGPQYLFGGALAGAMHAANRQLGWEYSVMVLPAVYLLYRSYYLYLNRLEEEKKHVQEVADLHLRTIEALSLAIEAKDETTHAHLRRVQIYATEIGREFGLSEAEANALKAAALLHDIGKLAVPEYILSKPGRLTPEEFEKIKIHPVVGSNILNQVNFPYPVAPIVLSHHEKWNGTGYPYGLSGEQIPIGARILAAVDVLDALASDRQYRCALPLDQAIEEVRSLSGTHFDPAVVKVLCSKYLEYEALVQIEAKTSRAVERIRIPQGSPAAGFAAEEISRSMEEVNSSIDFISLIAGARQEFHLLHEATRDLGNSLRLEETLSLLALRLEPLIPYHAIAIFRLNGQTLLPQFASGTDAALFRSLVIPLGDGLSGWVAENRKPILNGNPAVEANCSTGERKFSLLGSAMAIPLQSTGGLVGVLTLYHQEQNAFSRDHLRILMAIGAKVARTIENAVEFDAARKTAESDPLTGLLNAKTLFVTLDQEIQKCRAESRPLAVFVLDLDGFKQVNDRLGHLAGNRVLVDFAAGLLENCRKSDSVARMGGDEFVVVCPDMGAPQAEARARLFEQVVSTISQSSCGDGMLSVSVGHALLGADGDDAGDLLALADERMYAEKQLHHGRRLNTGSSPQLAGTRPLPVFSEGL